MRKSLDIETALCERLEDAGYSASAHLIPQNLGEELPHVHVVRTGGYEADLVIEVNRVDLDVYGETAADAMTAACELSGWVRSLVGVLSYTSKITTLPYNNPDPRHPTIPRVTLKAEINTRTV